MKWLSRKFCLALVGLLYYGTVPMAFKYLEISDPVTLASIGGATIIIGYYFKVNKDSKITEAPSV